MNSFVSTVGACQRARSQLPHLFSDSLESFCKLFRLGHVAAEEVHVPCCRQRMSVERSREGRQLYAPKAGSDSLMSSTTTVA